MVSLGGVGHGELSEVFFGLTGLIFICLVLMLYDPTQVILINIGLLGDLWLINSQLRCSTLIILTVEVLQFDHPDILDVCIDYNPLLLLLRALVCECGCFVVFLVIYWLLETLPLTHVYTHALHAYIYASLHVHICIRDCLVRFGSLLVNLGALRGQILS